MSKPTIAICASSSTYGKVIAASAEIEQLGINLILPRTAREMRETGAVNIEAAGYTDIDPETKADLIRTHFKEVEASDAILVMNYEKNGKDNYIGANVLLEMGIAFFLKKPIFVLNDVPEYSPFLDEITGMLPIFLHGDLTKIKL